MKRQSGRRKADEPAKLSMASMIDVVFLLLIFFVVTINPTDVLAHLDASRPAPGGGDPDINLVKILVHPDGYVVNGNAIELESLGRRLERIAGFSRTTSIHITCSDRSAHSRLVKLLDLCAKAELRNIALSSM